MISALGGILATPDLHAATRVYPGGRDVVIFESFSKSRVELCPCILLLTMAMALSWLLNHPSARLWTRSDRSRTTKSGRSDSPVASPSLSGFVCHPFTISIIDPHRRHGDTVVHAVARCDRQAPPIVSSFAFFFAACSLACFSSISKTFGSWHTQDGYGLYLVGFATCCLTPIFCLNIIKKH